MRTTLWSTVACKSWTYGKKANHAYTSRCHLKTVVQPNRQVSDCCDSGLPCQASPSPPPPPLLPQALTPAGGRVQNDFAPGENLYPGSVNECAAIAGCPSPTVGATCSIAINEGMRHKRECPCPARECGYTWTFMEAHINVATQKVQNMCQKVFSKTATLLHERCCASVLRPCCNWQEECYLKLAWTYCFFPITVPRDGAPAEIRNFPCAGLLEGNVTCHDTEMTMRREQEKASQQEVSLDESLSGKRTCG